MLAQRNRNYYNYLILYSSMKGENILTFNPYSMSQALGTEDPTMLISVSTHPLSIYPLLTPDSDMINDQYKKASQSSKHCRTQTMRSV